MSAEESGINLNKYNDQPNLLKLLTALTNPPLNKKWKAVGDEKAHLGFLLQMFFDEEEFEDDNLKEDFEDNDVGDCFFIEWLKDEENERPGMSIRDETILQNVYNDIKAVFSDNVSLSRSSGDQKDKDEDSTDTDEGDGDDGYNLDNKDNNDDVILPDGDNEGPDVKYNIIVSNDGINLIERLLTKQCEDLLVKEMIQDKATYGIIMIGKQNNNQPLLMYICDSFNRYRIMKMKRASRKYFGSDTPEFRKKWSDPSSKKFINEKCKGIESLLGKDYKDEQIQQFKDSCSSSINVFYRRLLGRPPMTRFASHSVIKDNMITIYWYIFQAYSFVHRYVCEENQPKKGGPDPIPTSVPCQIDLVIIPKDFKQAQIGGMSDIENSDDEDDECDDEQKEEALGNIDERLKGQKDVVKEDANDISQRKIKPGTADRTMRQAIERLFENKRHQRGIMIIDRRGNDKEDMFYCYQPTDRQSTNGPIKCSSMHSNPETFLSESLIQNSRTCLIPKYENDGQHVKDIGVNRNVGDTLTFSFHCLSATEIRVYVSYCGWGTRFFIEDIKYYLPMIFEENEEKKLRYAFERMPDRSFANTYENCKKKCPDPKFEKFYKDLVHGANNRKPCH